MIGRFPWDPFPTDEADPGGDDPLLARIYRASVEGADAYRAVRSAVRRDQGTLRVGNRFVPDGRYREVGFVAFGHAANSMALAALHAIGDRLTQGFLAGPEPVPAELPFQGIEVRPGWGGAVAADEAVRAATEIAEGLTERDLLLILLSPGAVRGLALPPTGMTGEEFGGLLSTAHAHGATGREVGLLARVLGTGAVGGRLAAFAKRTDTATLIVERGDGATGIGGGPVQPVTPAERVEARSVLERTGLAFTVPASILGMLAPGGGSPTLQPTPTTRPLVVASPTDALRAAADAVFDKGWTSRLAFLEMRDGPEPAADRFLSRSEELVAAESLTSESRTKGVGTFAMATLGLPEGVDEGPALGSFLERAERGLRRREMSVGLFRTVGAVGSPEYPAGAVVGTPSEGEARVHAGRARAIPMRPGITDVGLLAVTLCRPPGVPARGP